MPEAKLRQLVGYLRHNSQKYSLDALRQQLLGQGIDAALIDEAIATYRAEGSLPPRQGLSGWKVALGCVGGLVMGGVSFVLLLVGICGPKGDGTHTDPAYLALAGAVVLGAFVCALYPFFAHWRRK